MIANLLWKVFLQPDVIYNSHDDNDNENNDDNDDNNGRSPCNLMAPIRLRAGFPSLRPGEHLDYQGIQENVLILTITLNCVKHSNTGLRTTGECSVKGRTMCWSSIRRNLWGRTHVFRSVSRPVVAFLLIRSAISFLFSMICSVWRVKRCFHRKIQGTWGVDTKMMFLHHRCSILLLSRSVPPTLPWTAQIR